MPGVATVLNLYPSEGVVIVVLSNINNNATVNRIAGAIAAAMLPRYATTRDERRSRAAMTSSASNGPSPFAPPADLVSAWRGQILVAGGSVPLYLDVRPDGDVYVRFANAPATMLADRSFANGWFSGRVRAAQLRPPDATPAGESNRVVVTFNLRQNGGRLTGWSSSTSRPPLDYGAVSYRTELNRVANEDGRLGAWPTASARARLYGPLAAILVCFAGAFVCFVWVAVKLFRDRGLVWGLLGLVAFPYVFAWGWRHARRLQFVRLMSVWTVAALGFLAIAVWFLGD
jgi:hypothetical protein